MLNGLVYLATRGHYYALVSWLSNFLSQPPWPHLTNDVRLE